MTSARESLILGIAVSVSALASPSAPDLGAADSSLPSARQLVAEALSLFPEAKEDNSLPRSEVAVALGYLGDISQARSILDAHESNVSIDTAHDHLDEIEIERTGKEPPLRPGVFKDLIPDYTRVIRARAWARAGHAEKALDYIRPLSTGRGSSLQPGAHWVVEPLLAGGHPAAARDVLVLWSQCFADSKSVFDYNPRENIEQMIGWLVEYGERERARSLCERWRTVLETDADIDENGEYIGRGWAQLGVGLAKVGDNDQSRKALEESVRWLDKAKDAKLNPHEAHQCIGFASAYAAIASRIAVVLGRDIAAETYDKACSLAHLATASNYGSYGYEKIVDSQLEVDDEVGARETIDRFSSHRYRAKCWKRIADNALKRGRVDSARSAAKLAFTELDRDGHEPFMAHDIAHVAATIAQVGETDLARRLFMRALALSEENEDPKFDHSWIARMQVHAGLFADAYQTINAIPEVEDRRWPLAKLAREAAKREHVTAKKSKGEQG